MSFDECIQYIYEKFPFSSLHNSVHTIPNALIVAAALLYGQGDFTKSLGLAVMAGMDTDCNGATVGSIVGMVNGAKQIDTEWTEPLQDTLRTDIIGYSTVRLKDLAERTLRFIV